jgi:hypothetical protein
MILENLGRIAPRDGGGVFSASHVIASAATQSIVTAHAERKMDCFASLAMTVS